MGGVAMVIMDRYIEGEFLGFEARAHLPFLIWNDAQRSYGQVPSGDQAMHVSTR